MEIVYIICLSIFSIITLFVLTKIMGRRQISEMSMFDYITGITIGSIAAEMATSLENNFWHPFTAMVIYALTTVLLSILSEHSLKARRMISGNPLILLYGGEIYKKNLKKAKIELSELLEQSRINGYFDLNELDVILQESNGKLSFLPKSDHRPVTPADMTLSVEQQSLCAVLIMDGVLLPNNLKHCGKDEIWLKRHLTTYQIHDYKEVLLATCDRNNKLSVYPKTSAKKQIGDILS